MKAFIRSMKSAAEGSKDTVQIRIDEEEMAQHGAVLLQLQRYHHVTVKAESNQSAITENGGQTFPAIEFQAFATAFLISVLPNGQKATLTFSVNQEDQVIQKIIQNQIKGVPVDVSFSEGEAPSQE